jgi:flagellar hook-associated protein 2
MATIGASSISGLSSGLDTTAIVSQLMAVEQLPQQSLKNKVTDDQKQITAYQSVNTKMAAVKTAADALMLATTWQATAATSSSSTVTATASAGAPPGDYSFDVRALAKTQVTTALLPTGTTAAAAGTQLGISINGAPQTMLDITDNSAQGLADLINAANIGVKAMTISTDQGVVLQFTATKSGTANSFAIYGLAANAMVIDQSTAADAVIGVGNVNNGGYTVTSSSNTFTNLIPNVTLTATQVQAGVTVTVASDGAGLAAQMQSLVTAANNALTEISSQTAYTAGANGAAGTAGALLGESGVQSLQGRLLGAVSAGALNFGSFQQLGLQLDKTGKLTFDSAAFVAAYQANPSGVQAAVQNGVAASLDAVAIAATNSTTGTLTTAIQGRTDDVTSLTGQIDQWATRLNDRQAALQAQFTTMEVALGKLKDQSNWLTGQLASLPTNLSNSGKG